MRAETKRNEMSESDMMRAIQIEASARGGRLFRNNVGLAVDAFGQHIRYGLAVGSSDLIGWMTRGGVAVFTAVEVKAGRRKPTEEQTRFLDAVRAAGGIAILAYSVTDFIEGVGNE